MKIAKLPRATQILGIRRNTICMKREKGCDLADIVEEGAVKPLSSFPLKSILHTVHTVYPR